MTTQTFDATVTNIEDPEKRGRIEVSCAGLLGDEDSTLPMWVEPNTDWGWFYVPDVGELVEIEHVSSTSDDGAKYARCARCPLEREKILDRRRDRRRCATSPHPRRFHQKLRETTRVRNSKRPYYVFR